MFSSKSLYPPQFLLGKLYFEHFPFSFENFHCLVYHIRYHHYQDEVLWKIYLLSVKHCDEDLMKVFLIRPINLLHFLIYLSIWVLKLRFEPKTTPKCFWREYLVILLFLSLAWNAIGYLKLIYRRKWLNFPVC